MLALRDGGVLAQLVDWAMSRITDDALRAFRDDRSGAVRSDEIADVVNEALARGDEIARMMHAADDMAKYARSLELARDTARDEIAALRDFLARTLYSAEHDSIYGNPVRLESWRQQARALVARGGKETE